MFVLYIQVAIFISIYTAIIIIICSKLLRPRHYYVRGEIVEVKSIEHIPTLVDQPEQRQIDVDASREFA